ncbi:unnamed protein product [Didymodactylos carnosus]|uniref:BHLH domain-containing protein n=1 Tax=Didymodactylos carnosus TaxID=1234261 RepID=A0A814HSM1_9BILA|nr:unnamed protein product [Didymodactylos carnosus]CAF1158116.1 unnamed protein product [Didymodactylos carnosus]CAF3786355.1 unnamed protein product [Didymodactylos carnosus]CAF3969662.1 unnamed protein product [Didymodactylos carnosus]
MITCQHDKEFSSLSSNSSSSISSIRPTFGDYTFCDVTTANNELNYYPPFYSFIGQNWTPTDLNLTSTMVPSCKCDNMLSMVKQPKPKRRRVATIAQRRAANIRERKRMYNLNEAFDQLREIVPIFAYEKKLSRIETLRLAITYIAFMTQIINGKTVETASLNPEKVLEEWFADPNNLAASNQQSFTEASYFFDTDSSCSFD